MSEHRGWQVKQWRSPSGGAHSPFGGFAPKGGHLMARKELPTPDECQALWAALADVQEETVDPFYVRVLDVANSDVGRLDVNFESIGALLVWVEETRSLLVTMIEQLTQVDLVAFRELADMAREAPGEHTGSDPHFSTLPRSAPEIVTATRQFVERELAA